MLGINSSREKCNYAFETVCFALPSLAEAVCEQGAAVECEFLHLTQPEGERFSSTAFRNNAWLTTDAPAYKYA